MRELVRETQKQTKIYVGRMAIEYIFYGDRTSSQT